MTYFKLCPGSWHDFSGATEYSRKAMKAAVCVLPALLVLLVLGEAAGVRQERGNVNLKFLYV